MGQLISGNFADVAAKLIYRSADEVSSERQAACNGKYFHENPLNN